MSNAKMMATVLAALCFSLPVAAADIAVPAPSQPAPAFAPGWTFRVTPYGWLTSLNGTQVVRGRGVDIDASFIDIVESTIGDGGSLIALSANVEARHGRFALIGDIIAEQLTISRSGMKSRTPQPGVAGTVGAAVDLQFQMAIVEAGAAYEIGRIGSVAFDVLAGGRYWYQKVDLGVDLAGTFDLNGLVIGAGSAIARSGSVDWVDAFAGVRASISLAPHHNLELRGDIGAGGSDFTWHALAAYTYDFKTKNNVTYSALLGYKALYVDYTRGEGSNRYGFDMLQHGPVVGMSVRF